MCIEVKRLTENISYVAGQLEPLSADMGIVDVNGELFIYDVGSLEDNARYINNLDRKVNIVISHFHEDHMSALKFIDKDRINALYVSNVTFRYSHFGTVVNVGDTISLADGRIEIRRLPSSHAKGCLAMMADNEYLFMGDGMYMGTKNGETAYDTNLLKEEIAFLESVPATKCVLSHDRKYVRNKAIVLRELNKWLSVK